MNVTGNIRVYCRVRPFLPGQANGLNILDEIVDNALTIQTSVKHGKGKKTFNFNKAFGPNSTQGYLIRRPTFCSYISSPEKNMLKEVRLCLCRRGIRRYSATDPVSPRRIQRVHIRIWPNRIRENLHNGEKRRHMCLLD